jgi:hypothetical protein
MLAIEVVNTRRHFARSPFTDRLFEQALVVGKVEVDHWSKQLSALGYQLSAISRTPLFKNRKRQLKADS